MKTNLLTTQKLGDLIKIIITRFVVPLLFTRFYSKYVQAIGKNEIHSQQAKNRSSEDIKNKATGRPS